MGPLQRLYFMNNGFVADRAKALAGRLAAAASDDRERINAAYRLLFARAPTGDEIALGLRFLQAKDKAWEQYAQVLLSSAEFSSIN